MEPILTQQERTNTKTYGQTYTYSTNMAWSDSKFSNFHVSLRNTAKEPGFFTTGFPQSPQLQWFCQAQWHPPSLWPSCAPRLHVVQSGNEGLTTNNKNTVILLRHSKPKRQLKLADQNFIFIIHRVPLIFVYNINWGTLSSLISLYVVNLWRLKIYEIY